MAEVHKTTMSPTKIELLAAWLPSQSWYVDSGHEPSLRRAGGFRLDDPAGEVGIEFLVVVDDSGDTEVPYLVPMTYRGAAEPESEEGLIGLSEHGVLGTRWLYDGAQDQVLVAELLNLVQGIAQAQAQSASDTADPTVLVSQWTQPEPLVTEGSVVVHAPGSATQLVIDAGTPDGNRRSVTLEIVRRLETTDDIGSEKTLGSVTAGWRAADGTELRGTFARVRAIV